MSQTDTKTRRGTPLWTRDYVLILGSTLLVWSGYYFLMVMMPLFVTRELGGSRSQVGLLSSSLALAAVTARLTGGWACDRFGRRPVQLAFLALFALVAFGYNLVTTLPMLFVLRFLHGFPFGGGTTSNMTVASDLVPPARRGEGIGYYATSQIAAYAVGPTLAFFILERSGFRGIFTAAGLLAVGALVLAWFIKHPRVCDPTVRFRAGAILEKRVLWTAFFAFFIALGYSGLVTFVSLYSEQVGVRNAGWFFALYALGVLLIRPLTGRMFDRRGPTLPVMVGLVGMVAALAMLALWRTPLGFHVSALLYGITYGACFPSLQAMAVGVVPPERRGAASATLFALFESGMAIGPYANGLLAETSGGYPLVFLVGGAVLLVPALLYFTRVLPAYEAHKM